MLKRLGGAAKQIFEFGGGRVDPKGITFCAFAASSRMGLVPLLPILDPAGSPKGEKRIPTLKIIHKFL